MFRFMAMTFSQADLGPLDVPYRALQHKESSKKGM